ncbi:hypothetical protein AK830_g5719 [Neonectria ditissima]|uniref:Uncharacterized protein n=1 Tax=Neonectria ditissima TaxID=78410 RepID=A0A0P7BL76_9HYPO|nr:hypothetical protein AK830_g5719 [Neonectria ditissima]
MANYQVLIIARIGQSYRCLAGVNYAEEYLDETLWTCRRVLCVFSDANNRLALKQELALAADFFNNEDKRTRDSSRSSDPYHTSDGVPCPFPFVTTCLLLGAAYNHNLLARKAKELPYDTWFDAIENSRNITVLDITVLEKVAYGLLTYIPPFDGHHKRFVGPLTGWEYCLRHNPEEHWSTIQKNNVILDLERFQLIRNTFLRGICFRRLHQAVSYSTDEQMPLDIQSSQPRPLISLRDQAAAKLFAHILSATEFDMSLIDPVRNIPGFQRMVKEYLLANPNDVGLTPTSGYLLQMAFAGDTRFEWHVFPNLSSEVLKVAFHGDILSKVSEISLPPPSAPDTPHEFIRALSTLASLNTLQILDHPARTDETMSLELYKSLAMLAPNLVKKKLVLSGLYSCGLREKRWLPQ